jgi:hypothetical protein
MKVFNHLHIYIGEKEVLTKRLSESEKEFRELSGRACVDAERMEAQLQSQSEQIAKVMYLHTHLHIFMYPYSYTYVYMSIAYISIFMHT